MTLFPVDLFIFLKQNARSLPGRSSITQNMMAHQLPSPVMISPASRAETSYSKTATSADASQSVCFLGTSADSRRVNTKKQKLDELVIEVFESQPKQSSAMYGHSQQVEILVEKGSRVLFDRFARFVSMSQCFFGLRHLDQLTSPRCSKATPARVPLWHGTEMFRC